MNQAKYTTVLVRRITREEIEKLKLHPKESVDDVIMRLINIARMVEAIQKVR